MTSRGTKPISIRRRALAAALAAVVLAASLVMIPSAPVSAEPHSLAYHALPANHPNWMNWVPDGTSLAQMSIPGTHQSAGDGQPESFCHTQYSTLTEQLDGGIRFMEVRGTRHDDYEIEIDHGSCNLGLNMYELSAELAHWIRAHPKETVILRLGDSGLEDSHDGWECLARNAKGNCTEDTDTAKTFHESFQNLLNQRVASLPLSGDFWDPTAIFGTGPGATNWRVPTLGEVRGKIVLHRGAGWDSDANTEADGLKNEDMAGSGRWDITSCDNSDPTNAAGEGATFCWQHTVEQAKKDMLTASATADDITANGGAASHNRIQFSQSDASGNLERPYVVADKVNKELFYFLGSTSHMVPKASPGAIGPFRGSSTGVTSMDFPGPELISVIIARNLRWTDGTGPQPSPTDFESMARGTWAASESNVENVSGRLVETRRVWNLLLPGWDFAIGAQPSGAVGHARLHDGFANARFNTAFDFEDSYFHMVVAKDRSSNPPKQSWPSAEQLDSAVAAAFSSLSGGLFGRAKTVRDSVLAAKWPHYRWTVTATTDTMNSWVASLAANGGPFTGLPFTIVSTAHQGVRYMVYGVPLPNLAPTIDIATPPTPTVLDEGSSVDMRVTVNDAEVRLVGTDPVTAEGEIVALDVDWGDGAGWEEQGSAPAGATFNLSHRYLDDEPSTSQRAVYAIRIRARDAHGAETILEDPSHKIAVNNSPPTVQVGIPSLIRAGQETVFTVTAQDPGPAESVVVTLDLGDGTNKTVNFSGFDTSVPGGTSKTVGHVYSTPGPKTIRVTAVDDDGGTASPQEFPITVLDPLVATFNVPDGSEGSPVKLEGSFGATFSAPVTAEVEWGDGESDTLTVVGKTFSGDHAYEDQGRYKATVRLKAAGETHELNKFVAIEDTAAEVELKLDKSMVVEGDEVTLTLNLIDPGTHDKHTVAVEWGDGGVDNRRFNPATRSQTLKYTYAPDGPGTQTRVISVTATDRSNAPTPPAPDLPPAIALVEVVDPLPDIAVAQTAWIRPAWEWWNFTTASEFTITNNSAHPDTVELTALRDPGRRVGVHDVRVQLPGQSRTSRVAFDPLSNEHVIMPKLELAAGQSVRVTVDYRILYFPFFHGWVDQDPAVPRCDRGEAGFSHGLQVTGSSGAAASTAACVPYPLSR